MFRAGEGPPLLLLHGLAMSWRAWRPLLASLRTDHHVIAPTLPGHRGGPAAPADVSVTWLADYLETMLDEEGHDRVHVVGNSLGGWLALELALSRPSPQRHRRFTCRRVAQRVRPAPGPHAAAHRGRAQPRAARRVTGLRGDRQSAGPPGCPARAHGARRPRRGARRPRPPPLTPTPAGGARAAAGRAPRRLRARRGSCPARCASCGAAVTASSRTSGTADRSWLGCRAWRRSPSLARATSRPGTRRSCSRAWCGSTWHSPSGSGPRA